MPTARSPATTWCWRTTRLTAATYDYGGGYIYATYNSTIDLPNTRVTGNRAGDDYGGAYFEAYDHSTINVPDLYVYDNVAGGDYGGVTWMPAMATIRSSLPTPR